MAGCIIVHISSWWMGYLQHKSCIEFNENYVLEKIVKSSLSLDHSDDPHLKCVFWIKNEWLSLPPAAM